MLPVAMAGSIILWVVSRFEIFILNLECWLQICFKCISVMNGKQLSKTNMRPIATFFCLTFLFVCFCCCFGEISWKIKKMRNGSISTNCKSIYKLNNFLPNRVSSIPLVSTGHWNPTVALTWQSFMFHWKAPLQLCREKGAPLGMRLMEPILFETRGL